MIYSYKLNMDESLTIDVKYCIFHNNQSENVKGSVIEDNALNVNNLVTITRFSRFHTEY